MKLTPNQQELYEAMQSGVTVHYMPYMGRFNPHAYYFRYDTNSRCTAQAKALLKRGLVEKCNQTLNDHELRAKPTNPTRPDSKR